MNAKVLGLSGVLGSTAVGGGIYLSMRGTQESISNLLSSEKAILPIKESSDPKWNEVWKKYKEFNGGINKWGLKDWDKQQKETNAPEEFKNACESRSLMKVSNKEQQEYKDVKEWCTRPKKVSELLNSEGKRVLLNQSEDSAEWKNLWTQYKKHHENTPKTGDSTTYKTSDELGVNNWSSKTSQEEAPEEFKNACKTKSESYIDETKITEDQTFKRVMLWCTKAKTK
ncbi:hypothetical protein MHC_03775 [Mycoplasma haemocanis str. Illinois]|uniref:Uncharacterized protein n=1 Tax=Mycoplasma haemocanis (strain Illinois) TaxID=1111676 RepID=H6N7J3_MYCHN|nr:hypothetical protein [Mycoplasma haemocanis]AEW45615.1 hypothetical protein MHC_03775 [Mycoplasma haemocanis str. Illinois]